MRTSKNYGFFRNLNNLIKVYQLTCNLLRSDPLFAVKCFYQEDASIAYSIILFVKNIAFNCNYALRIKRYLRLKCVYQIHSKVKLK